MLTVTERLDNIEALLTNIFNRYNKLATDDELGAVSDEIFDEIDSLRTRIKVMEENTNMVKNIIDPATRI